MSYVGERIANRLEDLACRPVWPIGIYVGIHYAVREPTSQLLALFSVFLMSARAVECHCR